MQRLTDERGAVGVMIAMLLVPLLGFAAVAIDVAAMYSERQQLQTGADAGALAIAQDCNRGACGTPAQTAQTFAAANLTGSQPTATVPTLTASRVSVENSAVRAHWFAPVLGVNSTVLHARSTVSWGSPIAGTAVLPLAFSWCEWNAQTGGGLPSGTTPRTIYFPKSSDLPCTGPSNLPVPGGFGWLITDAGTCRTTSSIAGIIASDPGNSVPSSCSATDLTNARGRTVLLPIYDQVTGTGSGARYRVYGYAAFTFTGYHFGGQNSWNAPCSGDNRCIRGYFARFVDSSDSFHYGTGSPQLGATILTLTQ
ncbi:MAG TPA: TadE/TadG family type IV pilus assembly protein [Dermatophilaceae bacterium]|nr:TadE/TadG family type IV pilus assembly protein [Dermatophilaceae bacterium]